MIEHNNSYLLLVLNFVGIHDVMHDNRTEHLRTINILERFNIYQEVILAALYRILPIQVHVLLFCREMIIL